YLAKNNPDLNLVFIGKINGRSIRHLYKYRNIYLLGEIEYPYLRCYLAYFDVCIIPFIINDLIQNTDPVKFYEYISAGKPVVSNMLPELQKYKDICYLYKSPNSFNRNIMKALKENDPKIVAKRKIIARNNSWDKRVIEILNCISSIE
ncbi:MAG TPA: glycosyltransferase, partial [Bacilli bacterium]|nr:glycosyltransferase [Bacilli bacterium]